MTDEEGELLAPLYALATPQKIQDFLDALPINHEKNGETCFSPRLVLRHKKAHCLEGALLAAAALKLHGQTPLIINFKTLEGDEDHAVTLFKQDGLWGALSKTNHAVLRYRDPLYKTVRELALSYFHEYFLTTTGKKTMCAYSKPMNMNRFGTAWIATEEELWPIAYALADMPHIPIASKKALAKARPATPFERTAYDRTEWATTHPGT